MHIAYFYFTKEDCIDISEFIEEYCLFKEFKLILEKFDSENVFFKNFEPKKYRLAIFDISNNGKRCIEAARKVKEIDPTIPIIFFASNKYFAYDAFLLYAVDYILKPIKMERLEKTFDKVFKGINIVKKYITVNSNKIMTKINVSNIMYIEVIGNISSIHLSSNSIVKTYVTISEFEKMLKNNPLFLRTHKSFIVNMDYISDMKGNIFIMKNGDAISIRKNNCKEIKRTYQRFIANRGHRWVTAN